MPPSKTLFDHSIDFTQFRGVQPGSVPYAMCLGWLLNRDEEQYDELEACIFEQIAEHEVARYEQRGYFAGPLCVRIDGHVHNLNGTQTALALPQWIEADGLVFEDCRAEGVLVVETRTEFEPLLAAGVCERLNLILFTGCGVPRHDARRFLHRLSHEFHLPVYLLVDNDAWGYFFYSILARGVLWPAAHHPYLAVDTLRYLGLASGDHRRLGGLEVPTRPWKPLWDLRLAALRAYPCFASPAWQAELTAWETEHTACEVRRAIETIGGTGLIDELARRMAGGRWISSD